MTSMHYLVTYIFKLFGIGAIALNKNALKILGNLEIIQ